MAALVGDVLDVVAALLGQVLEVVAVLLEQVLEGDTTAPVLSTSPTGSGASGVTGPTGGVASGIKGPTGRGARRASIAYTILLQLNPKWYPPLAYLVSKSESECSG